MKKIRNILTSLILVICLCSLTSCKKTYSISYNLDGGKLDSYVNEFKKGDEISLETPYKEGYIFDGWYLDFELTNKVTDKLDTSKKQNIVLYAKWIKEKSNFTVTFDTGVGINEETVVEGTKVNKPSDPVREGFLFNGWYINGEEFNFDTEISSNITIVANWTKLYKITFKNCELEATYELGTEDFELPIPEKDGHIFLGWYTSFAFTGEPVTKIEKGFKTNLSFVARWVKGNTITYDVQEGIMPDEYQEYYEYESEYILPIPTRLGYSFKGWTENPNFEKPSVIDRIPIVYEEDVTLTAVWEKVTYTIDYVFGKHMYSNYKQLYRAFFSDFYYYIKDYRGAEYSLIKSGANNVEDFLEICSSYTGGSAGMGKIGDKYGSYYLRIDTGGKIEDQHSDDGFIGYCLDNNMYVEFIYFIQDFFYYWRLEEGYTNSSADPNGTGSDFLASAWASIVDTAKFFYYSPYAEKGDPHRLPSYFFREGYKVPTFYERIPYIVKISTGELNYTYDWESEFILPTDISYDGYKFIGWYDNPEFNGEPITKLEKGIHSNIKVYAKFEKEN